MGNQVGIQVINKCKIQMIRKDLYNMEELPWSGGQKKSEREYCSMLNNPNIVIYIYIWSPRKKDPLVIIAFIHIWLILNSMLAVAQLI